MSARRRDGTVLLAALLLGAGAPAQAADKWIVQGLLDAEVWRTDSESVTLSRDEGDTAPAGRLRLWTAGDLGPGLQGFVRGEVYGGPASGEDGTETTLELAFARYTVPGRARLVLEGGRIVTPVGDFAQRYLSSVNPLVGSPAIYGIEYPDGVKASGWIGPVDYTVAYIDQPLSGTRYTETTGRAFRPVLAAGVTPFAGFRIGAYATRGPYLGPESDEYLPADRGWRDYDENVVGFDTQFSRGYFELHAETTRSRYDVPTVAQAGHGWMWYVEPKYTITPRLFVALRVERNDYQWVKPLAGTTWRTADLSVGDAELGVGYRVATGALFKVSYRREHWNVDEAIRDYYPDGYALAAQLSWTFDVLGMASRPR